MGVGAAGACRARIGVGRELARLQDRVEQIASRERGRAGPPLPQPAPAPDCDWNALHRGQQRVVRKDPVEEQDARLSLGDGDPQAGRRSARPEEVAAGADAAVRRHVLDRKAQLPNHRGGAGKRDEQRLDLRVEAARDRHRSRQVP